ncbi:MULTISPECIES: transcriptional regulator [unclassified Micromonospora]|uniref:transcriptional regulator n=1 Tax=unclassified Micromonospora TaxID=2617518 RepID=UPI002499B43E|nr:MULTISPECIES: transcriptional regulator [unclassified Micromonospora]WFE32930.1 transcriptional regulator [Micromonospora sp. WMMD975]WFE37440.1 transcriptional regulator [Micromonospora sp. WMMD998]
MALRGGTRFSVPFEAVFPHGAVFVPDSIAEAQDFNEVTRQRTPAKDKVTGQRVWQCRVMDMDPELGSRSREVAIKILADVQPVPPVGPFERVEFEGLNVTPYVGSNGRLAFSYRATGLVAPKTLAESRGKAA